jgi:hypothetical protein
MAINFHLASGANHPWLIPKEGFDETIDVDAVLAMFQLTLFGFATSRLLRIRAQRPAGSRIAAEAA